MLYPSCMKRCALFVLAACLLAAAQPSPRIYQGSWTATAGTRAFQGRWTAHITPRRANVANGTWTLIDQAGRVVLEGTWSANQENGQWRGSFLAQAAGRKFAGSWKADLGDVEPGTFAEMLRRATLGEVSGAWQAAALVGNWWLGP